MAKISATTKGTPAAAAAGNVVSGVATLNFGAIGSIGNEASVVVSGLTGILTTSTVDAWVRNEATAEHTLDDLKYDPIRVFVDESTIVAGASMTIVGIMPQGQAYGNYKINWSYS